MSLPNIFESETKPLSFKSSTIIFQEGQPGTDMYIVKQGEVELRVHGKSVEVVGSEGFFGEMAVIEGGQRSATAIAKSDCILIPVNAKRFEFMVHEVNGFAVEVMKVLARRLRSFNETA
ncbi:MAG TPA: cyclic nucleotide-binding domain-containing protein [Verrucomicrobiaceae bacterium]|jgi:CRP-like cAMP-binding protein